jgi:hypothetical protein
MATKPYLAKIHIRRRPQHRCRRGGRFSCRRRRTIIHGVHLALRVRRGRRQAMSCSRGSRSVSRIPTVNLAEHPDTVKAAVALDYSGKMARLIDETP